MDSSSDSAIVRLIDYGAVPLLTYEFKTSSADTQSNTLSKLLKASGKKYAPTLVLDLVTNKVTRFADVKNDRIQGGAQLELYGGAVDVLLKGKRSAYGSLLKAAFSKKTRQAAFRIILAALLMIFSVVAMWVAETHGGSPMATNLTSTRLEMDYIRSLHFSARGLVCANGASASNQFNGDALLLGLTCTGAHVTRIFDHVAEGERTTGAQLTCDSFEAKAASLQGRVEGHFCLALVGRSANFSGFETWGFERMVEERIFGRERVYIPSGDTTYVTHYVTMEVQKKAYIAWTLASVMLFKLRKLQVRTVTVLLPVLLFGLGTSLALILPYGDPTSYPPPPQAAQGHSFHAFWTSNCLFVPAAFYFFVQSQLSMAKELLE